MKLSINTKNQPKIIILCEFIFAAVIIIFLILPQVKNINKTIKEIHEQKNKIEELNKKKKGLEKFKKDNSQIRKINDELSSSLIVSDNVLDFVVQLENIAKKTNVVQQLQIQEEKQNAKPDKSTAETADEPTQEKNSNEMSSKQNILKGKNPLDAVSGLPVLAYLDGKFKDLLAYLIYLENSSYATDINTATFTSSAAPTNIPGINAQEKPKEGKISATLELKVFTKD